MPVLDTQERLGLQQRQQLLLHCGQEQNHAALIVGYRYSLSSQPEVALHSVGQQSVRHTMILQ